MEWKDAFMCVPPTPTPKYPTSKCFYRTEVAAIMNNPDVYCALQILVHLEGLGRMIVSEKMKFYAYLTETNPIEHWRTSIWANMHILALQIYALIGICPPDTLPISPVSVSGTEELKVSGFPGEDIQWTILEFPTR